MIVDDSLRTHPPTLTIINYHDIMSYHAPGQTEKKTIINYHENCEHVQSEW